MDWDLFYFYIGPLPCSFFLAELEGGLGEGWSVGVALGVGVLDDLVKGVVAVVEGLS